MKIPFRLLYLDTGSYYIAVMLASAVDRKKFTKQFINKNKSSSFLANDRIINFKTEDTVVGDRARVKCKRQTTRTAINI